MDSKKGSIIMAVLGGILLAAGILIPKGIMFMTIVGGTLLGFGVINIVLHQLVSNSPRAMLIENDERNVQLDGMATVTAYKFAKFTITLGILYIWFSYKDAVGVVIFIVLYLVSDVIYVIKKRSLNY